MKQHEHIPLEEQPILGQQERLPFFATPAGRTISALLMIVIVGLVLIMSQGSGALSYEMDDMQLAVAGPDKSPVFLPYSSIQAVRLVSDFTLQWPRRIGMTGGAGSTKMRTLACLPCMPTAAAATLL